MHSLIYRFKIWLKKKKKGFTYTKRDSWKKRANRTSGKNLLRTSPLERIRWATPQERLLLFYTFH